MAYSKRIDSVNNPRIKELSRLKDGKGDYFLVEGYHLYEEARRHGQVVEVFSIDPIEGEEATIVSRPVLEKLCSSVTPEGVVALCRKNTPKGLKGNVLVLDEVADPGNVGTLLRTALAFGYTDVIAIRGSARLYGPKVVSASQGAIFQLGLYDGVSREEALSLLKGYDIVTTDLHGEDIEKMDLGGPIALVMGNEARGVSEEMGKAASYRAYIKMGNIDSLNVAVAGAIAMYVLSRKD